VVMVCRDSPTSHRVLQGNVFAVVCGGKLCWRYYSVDQDCTSASGADSSHRALFGRVKNPTMRRSITDGAKFRIAVADSGRVARWMLIRIAQRAPSRVCARQSAIDQASEVISVGNRHVVTTKQRAGSADSDRKVFRTRRSRTQQLLTPREDEPSASPRFVASIFVFS
jgi:hypothetical protein